MAAAPVHPDMALWRQLVQDWYPDLYQRTHFLPPVHLHRTQHEEVQLAWGHPVLVTRPPLSDRPPGAASLLSESDVREDLSLQRVLHCLHQLSQAHTQVMFVLSNFQFGHYLNKATYAAAAASLPRPIQLRCQNKHRGDFDVLLLHRQHGILVGEIKAIGDTPSSLPQQQQDQLVKKKVEQAIRQLHKAKDVLQHLLSDLQPPPRVQTTLMLPNLARGQLQRVLADNPQLSQDLCQCLGVPVTADPVPLCLTSDDVTTPDQWWQQLVTGSGTDPAMTDTVYLDLVSRFGGPASTVAVFCSSQPRLASVHRPDVRTAGEGVGETASRFTPVHIVLHPTQVHVLNTQGQLVFLTGPPGTGKTLMLVMKGLEWLRQKRPVQVVSERKGSLAATQMVYSQLQQTAGPAASHLIHMHTFDLEADLDAAVVILVTSVQAGQLFVIADEVFGRSFIELVTELQQRVPNLHTWAASMHHRSRPPQLTEVILTQPLRSPPEVTRQVERYSNMGQGRHVHGYTAAPCPLPCDGPPVKVVVHSGQGHVGDSPVDCVQCGRDVGRFIQELCDVVAGRNSSSNSPAPPRYRDVFILTHSASLQGAVRDASGRETQATSGLLRGVRQSDVPVTVLRRGDAAGIRHVANMAGRDEAVAAGVFDVQGLERKVVVWVQARRSTSIFDDENEGRLLAMSRATSQLVWVKLPSSPPPTPSSQSPSSSSSLL